MSSEIRDHPFDPYLELAQHRQKRLVEPGQIGAAVSFVGTMRDFNDGETVTGMTLEYYPRMTEKYLDKICAEAMARWNLADVLILHRVGNIKPDDTIVLVCAWSARRAAAFDACRYLIEELKQRAPFWKQENLQTGTRWVVQNTPRSISK